MNNHKHDLAIKDRLVDITFDDDLKEVTVFLTCKIDGCDYWRQDTYKYDVSELPNGDFEALEDLM